MFRYSAGPGICRRPPALRSAATGFRRAVCRVVCTNAGGNGRPGARNGSAGAESRTGESVGADGERGVGNREPGAVFGNRVEVNRSGPRIEDEKESGTLSAKVRNAARAGADGTAGEVEQEARGRVWTGRCAAVVRECERAVKMRKRGRAAERMIAFDTVGICRSLLAAGAKTVRNGVRTGVCLGCGAFFLVSDEAERNRTGTGREQDGCTIRTQ